MALILEYTRAGGRRRENDNWTMRIAKPPVMPPTVIEIEPGKAWRRRNGDSLETWRVVEAA